MTFDLDEYLKTSVKIDILDDLFAHFEGAIRELGYESAVFIFFPPKKYADETVPLCPYFNIHEEIVSTYLSHELYKVGPVFEQAKTTGKPVIWSHILNNKKRIEKHPNLVKFLEMLRSYGFHDGFTIPVFGVSNSFGCFSFGAREKEVNFSCDNLVLLCHVCFNLMKKYQRITEKDQLSKAIKLTEREKEVLSWVLKDKSNSVIADIMGISEHTVSTYIRRSAKKLHASSKWSAALTAVLTGLIQY